MDPLLLQDGFALVVLYHQHLVNNFDRKSRVAIGNGNDR